MSKADIFSNLRRGLNPGRNLDQARSAVAQRLAAAAPNLIPQRAQLPQTECEQLFITMAREAAAEVIELSSLAAVPAAVAQCLTQAGVNELVMASDACLGKMDWQPLQGIHLRQGVALAGDQASLTCALAGIAETGTLMLHSGSDSPTTLNFLPDIHLVVLQRHDILGVYEQAWAKLRERFGQQLPRTVNLITGPSRSADIEQKLQMGAHGPRQLIILLIG